MTDIQKNAEMIARALSRLKSLADALEAFADVERDRMELAGGSRDQFAAGRYAAFHLAACSIRDALAGRAPEAITSAYISAKLPHLGMSYEEAIILVGRDSLK